MAAEQTGGYNRLIGASKPEQILSNLKAAEKQRTTEMEAEELVLIEKAVNLYHA